MNQVFSKPVQIDVLEDLMKKLDFYEPAKDGKEREKSPIDYSQIKLLDCAEDLSIQDE